VPGRDDLTDGEAVEDIDTLNEIVMAVDLRDKGTVGCAYYVAQNEKFYFMEDVKFGGPEIVETCNVPRSVGGIGYWPLPVKLFINPTIILASTRADDNVINCLDPEAREQNSCNGSSKWPFLLHKHGNADHPSTGDPFNLPYLLELRPSLEFNYEASKSKLINLQIGANNGPQVTFVVPGDVHVATEYDDEENEAFAGRQAQLLRLSGLINVESQLTVCDTTSDRIIMYSTSLGWVCWRAPVILTEKKGCEILARRCGCTYTVPYIDYWDVYSPWDYVRTILSYG